MSTTWNIFCTFFHFFFHILPHLRAVVISEMRFIFVLLQATIKLNTPLRPLIRMGPLCSVMKKGKKKIEEMPWLCEASLKRHLRLVRQLLLSPPTPPSPFYLPISISYQVSHFAVCRPKPRQLIGASCVLSTCCYLLHK